MNYIISRLDKKHIKDTFDCGVDALNHYLKVQASQDMKKSVSVTHVLTTADQHQVLGYYTLSYIGISPGELPESVIKKLPRYPTLPGILIGRLARDIQFRGKELGQYLLVDALKRSFDISTQLGSVAVVVDVKNKKASEFYQSFGFLTLPDNGRRLFLPMQTIKKMGL